MSSLFLNVLTLFALITEAGKLFHIFTILTEMKTFSDHNDISS